MELARLAAERATEASKSVDTSRDWWTQHGLDGLKQSGKPQSSGYGELVSTEQVSVYPVSQRYHIDTASQPVEDDQEGMVTDVKVQTIPTHTDTPQKGSKRSLRGRSLRR